MFYYYLHYYELFSLGSLTLCYVRFRIKLTVFVQSRTNIFYGTCRLFSLECGWKDTVLSNALEQQQQYRSGVKEEKEGELSRED